MLKSFRKHTKIIIWIVAISFILWGGFSVGVSIKGPGRYAGEAFGKNVTFQEFNRFHKATQIFSFTGNESSDPNILRQQTWQNILYAREAKKIGIDVSDEEVRNEIKRIFASQGIENLSSEMYKEWLSRTVRLPAHEFETLIREMIRIQKLLRDVSQRTIEHPSEEEIKELFLNDNKKINYDVATFATEEDTKVFWGKFKTTNNWEESLTDSGVVESSTTGMIRLSDFLKSFPVDESSFEKLSLLELENISDPLPLGNEFAVFHLKEKVEANLSEFTDEKKEEYGSLIKTQRKQENFWLWNLDLYRRSELKDFSLEPSSTE